MKRRRILRHPVEAMETRFRSLRRAMTSCLLQHLLCDSRPSQVERRIPFCSQIECGLDAAGRPVSKRQNLNLSKGKGRRDEITDAIAAAMTSLTSSRESGRPILAHDSDPNNIAMQSQVIELDRSRKMANNVSSLMDPESAILSMMNGLSADEEYSKRC